MKLPVDLLTSRRQSTAQVLLRYRLTLFSIQLQMAVRPDRLGPVLPREES